MGSIEPVNQYKLYKHCTDSFLLMGKETEAFYMHAVSAIFTRGLSLSNGVHPHPPADSQEGYVSRRTAFSSLAF